MACVSFDDQLKQTTNPKELSSDMNQNVIIWDGKPRSFRKCDVFAGLGGVNAVVTRIATHKLCLRTCMSEGNFSGKIK